jgi:hypothetical protein
VGFEGVTVCDSLRWWTESRIEGKGVSNGASRDVETCVSS